MKIAIARTIEPHLGRLANIETRFVSEKLLCDLLDWTVRNSSPYGRGHWQTMVKTTSILRDQFGSHIVVAHLTEEGIPRKARLWEPETGYVTSQLRIIDGNKPAIRTRDRIFIPTKDAFRPMEIWDELPRLSFRTPSDLVMNTLSLSTRPTLPCWSFLMEKDGSSYAFMDNRAIIHAPMEGKVPVQPRLYGPVTHHGSYLSLEERRQADGILPN